jgi:hypothetical protein
MASSIKPPRRHMNLPCWRKATQGVSQHVNPKIPGFELATASSIKPPRRHMNFPCQTKSNTRSIKTCKS